MFELLPGLSPWARLPGHASLGPSPWVRVPGSASLGTLPWAPSPYAPARASPTPRGHCNMGPARGWRKAVRGFCWGGARRPPPGGERPPQRRAAPGLRLGLCALGGFGLGGLGLLGGRLAALCLVGRAHLRRNEGDGAARPFHRCPGARGGVIDDEGK